MIKKTIAVIVLSLALNITIFAEENGTGADPIFDLTGIVKPAEWRQWEEPEKHKYLQDRGAYPAYGNKYEGRVDMDRYFQNLGITKPLEWAELTPEDRTNFLTMLSEEALQKEEESAPEIIETRVTDTELLTLEDQTSPNTLPLPLWLIVCLVLGVGGIGIFMLKKSKK